jgi:hypothetical protein
MRQNNTEKNKNIESNIENKHEFIHWGCGIIKAINHIK